MRDTVLIIAVMVVLPLFVLSLAFAPEKKNPEIICLHNVAYYTDYHRLAPVVDSQTLGFVRCKHDR